MSSLKFKKFSKMRALIIGKKPSHNFISTKEVIAIEHSRRRVKTLKVRKIQLFCHSSQP